MQVDIRDVGLIPGSGEPLEKGTATHASIFAQRIQWTEESGELWYSVAESDTTEGT